jgi:rubrerythrin
MNAEEYREILQTAIQREIDAQDFYREASEKMAEGHLKELFSQFVQEEKKHEDILRGFIESTSPGDVLPFTEDRDYKVSETVENPRVAPDMKPADAFALAMKKEEEAMNQYTALAKGCTDREQAQIFKDLAAMERNHKLKMEQAFVETAFPEAW